MCNNGGSHGRSEGMRGHTPPEHRWRNTERVGRLGRLPPQPYYRKIGENVRNFVQNGCNPFCVNDLRTKKYAHDVGWVTALSPQPYYRQSSRNVRNFFPIVTTESVSTICHMSTCHCQDFDSWVEGYPSQPYYRQMGVNVRNFFWG